MTHKLTYTFHLTNAELMKRWKIASRLSYAKNVAKEYGSKEQLLYSAISEACYKEHCARWNVVRLNRERGFDN